MTLTEALDTFSDNLPDIITSMQLNLTLDMQAEKEDAKQLGTGWIADEVRRLRVEDRFGDTIRRLNRVRGYYNTQLNPTPGRITDEDILRAKDYPIQDMYTGKLRKAGKSLIGLCPFHNDRKHPSFHIRKNRYKCFTCDEGGDSIAFYMKQNGVNFIQAVKFLSNRG